MEPKFVTREEARVVGMECIGNDPQRFGQLWSEFLARITEIKNGCRPGVGYGLCGCGPECEASGTCKCLEVGFSYTACVEVSSVEDIPEGMVVKTIPEARYAVFTHKGSLDKLGATWDYIYKTWWPNSGFESGGNIAFELYDERFNPTGEDSELDIYVPVKSK